MENQFQQTQNHSFEEDKITYQKATDLINEDREILPLPKKNRHLPKPNLKHYQEIQHKNIEKIKGILEKKKKIKSENFKGSQKMAIDLKETFFKFKEKVQSFNETKNKMIEVKTKRNEKRHTLNELIKEAKEHNNTINELKQQIQGSREKLIEKLEKIEDKLLTTELSKKEEKQLNYNTMMIKKRLSEAKSVENVEMKLKEAEIKKEKLDIEIEKTKNQKDLLERQYKQLRDQLEKSNKKIEKVKEMMTENSIKLQNRQKNEKDWEEWQENKKKCVEEIEKKVQELVETIRNSWEQYSQKKKVYWQQKHKFDFIEWQHKIKNRKVFQKEKDRRVVQRQRERERREQTQYFYEIELCSFLNNYLQNMQEEWKKQNGGNRVVNEGSQDIGEKTFDEKKNIKRREEGEEEIRFEIPFNIQTMFENVGLSVPLGIEQVDKKIEEVEEREQLFERARREEISEEDREMIMNTKKEASEENENRKGSVEDFPALT